ncbi:predicted protein [Botrytis cinerea T4]|uniref:Uncharacterized protein n=1 Tax=Botryotinia fuckeliana (strain T4) TaxID=999810 RepID=G2XNC6_BOTF4|nr:predicted protein [Botrytis cinerea T4]
MSWCLRSSMVQKSKSLDLVNQNSIREKTTTMAHTAILNTFNIENGEYLDI